MVRKSASLKKATDAKVDGAYQDAVLKPIPGTGEFGAYQAQEQQISAVGAPPPGLAEQVVQTNGVPQAPQIPNIYGVSDRPLESVRQDTAGDSFVELPPASNVQVTKELLRRFYADQEIIDYLEL